MAETGGGWCYVARMVRRQSGNKVTESIATPQSLLAPCNEADFPDEFKDGPDAGWWLLTGSARGQPQLSPRRTFLR